MTLSTSVMKRMYQKALCRKTIPSRIADAEYTVRGKLPLHGEKIAQEITSGQVKYDFESVTTLHSGNPLALGQSPITFNREVLSVMMHPEIAKYQECVSQDAINRA
jgi:alanine transaminase